MSTKETGAGSAEKLRRVLAFLERERERLLQAGATFPVLDQFDQRIADLRDVLSADSNKGESK